MAAVAQLMNDIRAVVDTVGDPCGAALGRPIGLAEMGVVRDIDVDESGRVAVSLVLTDPLCPFQARFETEITAAVEALEGVSGCQVRVLDQMWSPDLDPRFRQWTHRDAAARGAQRARYAQPHTRG